MLFRYYFRCKRGAPQRIITCTYMYLHVLKIKKESASFLYDTGYIRERIKGSAGIAAPLFGLTGPKIKFIWNKKQKKGSCNSGIRTGHCKPINSWINIWERLVYFWHRWLWHCHSSRITNVSQIRDDKEVLISYNSKILTATRRKYYVTRREFLTVEHLLNTVTINGCLADPFFWKQTTTA